MPSGFLIIIVALFFLMWLLLIRPQRRRQAEQARMLAGLEVGDEVVTAGGLYGRILALGEDELTLEIAPGTNVRLARRAVAGVIRSELEGEDAAAELERAQEEIEDEAESSRGRPS